MNTKRKDDGLHYFPTIQNYPYKKLHVVFEGSTVTSAYYPEKKKKKYFQI